MERPAAINFDFVRPAVAEDAVDGVKAQYVAEPRSTAEVASILMACDQSGLRVVARGSGSKLDWGNPPRGADLILSTRKLDQVVEHADGDLTATVQAGCSVTALNNVLARKEQRLAIDPLWPDRATIGGIIATNDSGALRAAYGTLRDHLIGITVVLADGTIARSGGKVVKNVAGYDLPKLFIGSLGTLGVITEATFRLYSTPRCTQSVRLMVPDSDALGRLIIALSELSLITVAVQFQIELLDPIGVRVQIGGLPEAMEAKLNRAIQTAAEYGVSQVEIEADDWGARERLFDGGDVCVGQISLLPAKWPPFVQRMRDLARSGEFGWSIVCQIVGVGTIRLSGNDPTRFPITVKTIRAEIEKAGGSFVILRCAPEMKLKINVWPDGGNALPLMRRVKDQFDPHGTLSPGRFIGGI